MTSRTPALSERDSVPLIGRPVNGVPVPHLDELRRRSIRLVVQHARPMPFLTLRDNLRIVGIKSPNAVSISEEFATLASPSPTPLECLSFSPEGAELAVSVRGAVHLWDLRAVRTQIARIGLDGERPGGSPKSYERHFDPIQFESPITAEEHSGRGRRGRGETGPCRVRVTQPRDEPKGGPVHCVPKRATRESPSLQTGSTA